MARLLGIKQVPVFLETGDAKITTEYGYDIKDYPTRGKTGTHLALDLVRTSDGKASEVATIVAIADGVIYAQRKWMKNNGVKVPGQGNCVYIRHADGTVTKYYHLRPGMPDWIRDNVPVKKGDILGVMGNTGDSYGAHLHFQVEDESGNRLDPEPYLTGEKVIGKSDTSRYTISVSGEYDTETTDAALIVLADLGITAEKTQTKSDKPSIEAGSRVMLNKGASWVNGKAPPVWVYDTVLTVLTVTGDNAALSADGENYTGTSSVGDLTPVEV